MNVALGSLVFIVGSLLVLAGLFLATNAEACKRFVERTQGPADRTMLERRLSRPVDVQRHRIILRWLYPTILTGAGAMLLVGAAAGLRDW